MGITGFGLRFLCDCGFGKDVVQKRRIHMNCNSENRHDYLRAKIRGWKEVAICGIDKFERARGRRNLKRLTGAHPGIAAECGFGQPGSGMSDNTEFQIPERDG
jgi:hypothetical protein